MERFAAGSYPTNRGGNGEAGTHGTFGIGLSGFRPAEIDQRSVTDVTRDEAVELADRGGDARLVGADDLSQILGIQSRREAVEPMRSQNITLSGRRSAVVKAAAGPMAAAVCSDRTGPVGASTLIGAPQSPQNFAPA
jgi:hypothetical protein